MLIAEDAIETLFRFEELNRKHVKTRRSLLVSDELPRNVARKNVDALNVMLTVDECRKNGRFGWTSVSSGHRECAGGKEAEAT
jgi:hypothetical protein